MQYATLNTGAKIPMVAMGCFMGKGADPGDPDMAGDAAKLALEVGYRHFDTAALYQNEALVGQILRESGVPREEFFVTTKFWNDRHHDVEKAFFESLERFNLGYIDLFMMHWPISSKSGNDFEKDDTTNYIETWKKMEKLIADHPDKVKAIGVSNFSVKTLSDLLKHAKIVPAVNEVETHPYNQEQELVDLCKKHGIVVEAYCPLGQAGSPILKDEDILAVAKEANATAGQVILSWNVQRGVVVLPKSTHKERLAQNISTVKLTDAQMERIRRISEDPSRHCRFCAVYDPNTKTVLSWTYKELGWEKPANIE